MTQLHVLVGAAVIALAVIVGIRYVLLPWWRRNG